MKKLIFSLFAGLVMVSCHKKSDDPQPINPNPTHVSIVDTLTAKFSFAQASSASTPYGYYKFTNLSENNVTSFWDFGNGQISTLDSPYILFKQNKPYDVVLTVTSTSGETKKKTITVTISDIPTKCYLDKLVLKAFPAKDATGQDWDVAVTGNSTADIYMKVLEVNLSTSTFVDFADQDPANRFENCVAPVTLTVDSQLKIDANFGYSTALYDYDDTSSDDYIGNAPLDVYGLTYASTASGIKYPGTFTSNVNGITVIYQLRWE